MAATTYLGGPTPVAAKDPDSTVDYEWDWSDWLEGDTIASVVWVVPAGITQTTQSNTTTAATIWLSGGTDGTTYEVTCRITTAAGRTADRSARIPVREM